jgi:hypothetical protein
MHAESYLSIVGWPEGCDESSAVAILGTACAIAPIDAAQIYRRGTPAIIARTSREHASAMLDVLRTNRARAFVATADDLGRVPAPRSIKTMNAAVGAPEAMYMLEFWPPPPHQSDALRAADIVLLVRARVDQSVRRFSAETTPVSTSRVATGYLVGGVAGAMIAAASESVPAVNAKIDIRLRDMLDIYTRDGRLLRVDGGRFGFDVLGEDKALTREENMDRLALRLAREAPRALVDTGFANFHYPASLARDMTQVFGRTTIRRTDELPAFAFYSAWALLMYREIVKGRL